MTYRERYAPIIARVLRENRGASQQELRRALRQAFPDLPRKYHPYKIWLDEIRFQLGLQPAKKPLSRRPVKPLPDQMELFDG